MDNGNDNIPWSDLPKELLERIGKSLDTHIDILHFRAVCTSWRSSLPPFKSSPSLPLKLPVRGSDVPDHLRYPGQVGPDFYLIESTVYLFQPLDGGASSCGSGWLVMVTQTVDGKLRILNPLTDKVIDFFPDDMPKVLNLLEFRVSQVCKSYHLQLINPLTFRQYDDLRYARKVLFSTNHAQSHETNKFSVMAISHGDEVYYLKSGDEQWSKLKDSSCKFGDIIMYKGSFYVVDQCGETVKFDSSSFNETKVSSRLYDGGKNRKKRLVEMYAQLFLIDMIVDGTTPFDDDNWNNPLEIKMYRLDEEQEEWIEVHTLGDRILFAGSNCCFSVSSQDFGDRYRGNCIYYENGRGLFYDKFYEDDSDEDWCCGCCGSFYNDDDGPIVGAGVNESDSYVDDNRDHNDKNESGRDHNDKNEYGSDDDLNERCSDEDNKGECGSYMNGHINSDDHKNDCCSDDDGANEDTNEQCNDDDHKKDYSDNDDEMNERGSKSVLVLRYKGLYGHSPGVFTIEDSKHRPLSSSLEYADIFWPPVSCFYLEDQTPSSVLKKDK